MIISVFLEIEHALFTWPGSYFQNIYIYGHTLEKFERRWNPRKCRLHMESCWVTSKLLVGPDKKRNQVVLPSLPRCHVCVCHFLEFSKKKVEQRWMKVTLFRGISLLKTYTYICAPSHAGVAGKSLLSLFSWSPFLHASLKLITIHSSSITTRHGMARHGRLEDYYILQYIKKWNLTSLDLVFNNFRDSYHANHVHVVTLTPTMQNDSLPLLIFFAARASWRIILIQS